MPDVKRFALPDAGEGLTEAEIISWKVRPGDRVSVNQMIVEIETAKSLVELPCPFAGVVTELLVTEGSTVDVGTPIISVDVDPDGPPLPAPVSAAVPAQAPAAAPAPAPAPAGARQAVLVGYGPRESEGPRRAGRLAAFAAAPPNGVTGPAAPPSAPPPSPPAPAPASRPLAKPPVRKLARDLGLDLARIVPSGPAGVITRADVEQAAAAVAELSPSAAAATFEALAQQPRETRTPIKGVRKATAQAMVSSAFTAPHVTEWLAVDVTRTMKLVRRLRESPDFADLKVSPLLVVARAVVLAARRHPSVNSAWDQQTQEIVHRQYVNLGVAAATPRGLLVPNIKDADRLSLPQLAAALGSLVATARQGRTQPAELTGGTITITNVGVFGVDGGTPILNPGEAAILAVGQIRPTPWVHRGRVRPRSVLQLSLSFDHRLVDGEQGSRFLAEVGEALERPEIMLGW